MYKNKKNKKKKGYFLLESRGIFWNLKKMVGAVHNLRGCRK